MINLSQMATLFLLFGSCHGYLQEPITFPMRYVDHSINRSSADDDFKVPTGQCTRTSGEITLFLPRWCAPTRLYSGFIASDRVVCLSLRDNLIDCVSLGSFDCLPNLRYLDLSKNRIEFCDLLSFGSHESLRTLILDENAAIASRGGVIDQSSCFPRVEHLYLRKNEICELRFSLRRNFPSLEHLYLSDNNLGSAGLDSLELPSTLRDLHLERNGINRIDSRLVRQLHFLFLDGNEICEICASDSRRGSYINVRGAINLRFLSLSGNNIGRIDRDSFAEACNLRSLTLSRNNLETIEHGTFHWLRELRDLSLSHNRLRCVPSFGRATKLTSLTLDHNAIERIETDAFRDLTCLKWISLSDNRIAVVEIGAFRDLVALEELDLSNNELTCLPPGWINSNTRLRLLDLRGNRFTSFGYLNIHDVFTLDDLYFQNNPLSIREPPLRGTVTRHATVHLDDGIPSPIRIGCLEPCTYV